MTPGATRGLAMVAAAAVAAPTHAASPSTVDDLPLAIGQRVERHVARARAATAAGDAETAADEWVAACGAERYVAPAAPTCVTAEERARAFPALHSRYLAGLSCFAGWQLQWDRARELAAQALTVGAAGPAGDELAGEGIRIAHLCLGAIAIERGAYDEAARELAELLTLSERAGDAEHTGNALLWRCRLDDATGDTVAGDADCAAVLELAEQVHDQANYGNAYWIAGNYALDQGRYDEAIARWERGRRWAAGEGGAPLTLATLQVSLADAYTRVGRFADADAELLAQAADIAAGRLPASYELQRAAAAGALAAARGDFTAAIAAFDRAVASPMYGSALFALTGRARAQAAIGDLAGARASLEEAVRRIEAARARAPGDDQRRTYMDRHAEVFRALVQVIVQHDQPGAAEQALAAAEAGRARALLDAVRAAGLTSGPTAEPAEPAAIRAAIGPDRVLLEYVAAPDQLVVLRVTADAVTAIPLPGAGTRDELAARVAYFHDLVAEVDDPTALDPAGAALYRDLVAPALGDDPPSAVVIAPDGPLHGLPFDALRVRGAFLVERAAVALAPSGTFFATGGGRETGGSVLAVGAPIGDPRAALPAATAEIAALAGEVAPAPTVLAGAAASEARWRAAEPGRYGILHFATHATLDDTLPMRSALALTPAAGDDGALRADEIYRMRLGAALVVLSACRTATGAVGASEGPMSLARAFLHAGAAGVVATLWDVDDRQGPTFMTALYRELAGGDAIGTALAGAKRAMIGRRAPPRAWAAYEVIGDPRTAPRLGRPAAPAPVRGLVAGALATLGLACAAAGVLAPRRPPRGRPASVDAHANARIDVGVDRAE